MRRVLLFCAVTIVLCCIANADSDITEIQKKIDQCNYDIWSEASFYSAELPIGDYLIGSDVPANTYYIKSGSETVQCWVVSYPYDIDTYELSMQLYHPRNITGFYGNEQERIEVEDGDRFRINQASLIIVRADYKPDFSPDVEQKKAEVLSRYTELHQQLRKQLKAATGWRESVIPEGIWTIGDAIPPERWTFYNRNNQTITIYVGKEYFDTMTVYPDIGYTLEPGKNVSIDLTDFSLIQIIDGRAVMTTYYGHDLFNFE